MTREFTREISTGSISLNLMQMSSKKFNPFKDFQSDQIQRSSRKIFHWSLHVQECRFEVDSSFGND